MSRCFYAVKSAVRPVTERCKGARFLLLPALLALAVTTHACTAAGADEAQCASNLRPLTRAEEAYFSKLYEIKMDIPMPPDGWRTEKTDVPVIPAAVCYDFTAGTAGNSVLASYSRIIQPSAAQPDGDKTRNNETAAMEQIAALTGKQMRLLDELSRAISKNDFDESRRLNEELNANQTALAAAQSGTDVTGGKAVSAELQRDTRAVITVTINNRDTIGCRGAHIPLHIPGALAYRCEGESAMPDGSGFVLGGETHVCFGDWKVDHNKKDKELLITARMDEALPATFVQAVDIAVYAEKERAEGLLSGINLEELRKLLDSPVQPPVK